ncbi:hypothetical protein FRC12_019147 [Ceratobasidium sp. 428]|nr:hypothetical protein FRC12_019147 [Ceratobasidium sp. 428]
MPGRCARTRSSANTNRRTLQPDYDRPTRRELGSTWHGTTNATQNKRDPTPFVSPSSRTQGVPPVLPNQTRHWCTDPPALGCNQPPRQSLARTSGFRVLSQSRQLNVPDQDAREGKEDNKNAIPLVPVPPGAIHNYDPQLVNERVQRVTRHSPLPIAFHSVQAVC